MLLGWVKVKTIQCNYTCKSDVRHVYVSSLVRYETRSVK